jgi:DNA-binding NarL/FixJ family response regulator
MPSPKAQKGENMEIANQTVNTPQPVPGDQRSGHRFVMRSSPPSLWPDFLIGQAGRPVRVLLIDADPHMRYRIAQELVADERITLVAQAGTLREGRRMVSLHEFDVMMVDLNLGDGSGFDLLTHMKAVRPFAEAVVIAATEDEHHALHAFELGATGYLGKNSWFGNFPQAILQVVNGGASITPNLARRLLQKLDTKDTSTPVGYTRSMPGPLSDREKTVLKMVALGHTSTEIGQRLTISSQTVNTHVKNIYRKLQVRTRAQAVSRATHSGFL